MNNTFFKKAILSSVFTIALALVIVYPGNSAIIKSSFDDGCDGWTWSEGTPNAFTCEPSGGNPGGYIRFDNNKGPIDDASIHAPEKFLGNWKSMGVTKITYDAKIISTGSIYIEHEYRVHLSGPGGAATWFGPDPDPSAGWLGLEVPIDESLWSVTNGTWEALLSEVTDFRITMAYYNNWGPFEITGVDNVAIYMPWIKAYDNMLYNPSDINMLRQYRDEQLGRTFRGRLYTRLLYKNSAKFLKVLLANPELMAQAAMLIEVNKAAVADVLEGYEGTIYNTHEIADFLDEFAEKAPPTLKIITKIVKRHMLRNQRQGKLFFGFRLE